MNDTQVRKLFETVAQGYDMQNSVLSLGVDVLWRKTLARMLPAGRPITVLDAAAGTGEVSLEIRRQRPLALVLGLDFTPGMLAVAKKKLAARPAQGRIRLVAGDARSLPVADNSVDAVTIAFGIRNIEERGLALAEFFRVLKPGGTLYVMEFSLPQNPVARFFYRLYFDHVLPPFGNWLSRTDYAYTYLMTSVHAFPKPAVFAREFTQAGFVRVVNIPLWQGVATITAGVKP